MFPLSATQVVTRENAKEFGDAIRQVSKSCKDKCLSAVDDQMLQSKAQPVLQAMYSYHQALKSGLEAEPRIKKLSADTKDQVRYFLELKTLGELAQKLEKIYNVELAEKLKNYAICVQKVVNCFDKTTCARLHNECAQVVDALTQNCIKTKEAQKQYQEALWKESLSQVQHDSQPDPEQDNTQQARQMLENEISGYVQERNAVFVDSKEYSVVTRKTRAVSKKARASVGSSAKREFLLFDPENSPLLSAHYEKLKAELISANNIEKLTCEKMLKAVCAFVRKKIFFKCEDPQTEHLVMQLLQDYPKELAKSVQDKKGRARLTIPLEYFIEKGLGVCRHHTLVTLYLLDRLARDTDLPFIPTGRAMQMRAMLTTGTKHAWATYIEPGRSWHIDTIRNLVFEYTTKQEQDTLSRMLGKQVVAKQVKKTAKVRALWIKAHQYFSE